METIKIKLREKLDWILTVIVAFSGLVTSVIGAVALHVLEVDPFIGAAWSAVIALGFVLLVIAFADRISLYEEE